MKTPAPATVLSSEGKPMKLVWHDEFDVPGLPSPERWTFEEGYVRNRELQYYTRNRLENARVEDGRLILEARLDSYRHAGGTAICSSASINTHGIASWTFGRFEVRAKVPTGVGTWPAIWMIGANAGEVGWPRCGEIDIMEYVGFDPAGFHFTLHGPDTAASGRHVSSPPRRLSVQEADGAFATFVMEGYEGGFRSFVNGKSVATFSREELPFADWPFDKPHFLLLNLAIGGAWGAQKGIDEGIFPARFEVEYVRVYQ